MIIQSSAELGGPPYKVTWAPLWSSLRLGKARVSLLFCILILYWLGSDIRWWQISYQAFVTPWKKHVNFSLAKEPRAKLKSQMLAKRKERKKWSECFVTSMKLSFLHTCNLAAGLPRMKVRTNRPPRSPKKWCTRRGSRCELANNGRCWRDQRGCCVKAGCWLQTTLTWKREFAERATKTDEKRFSSPFF